MKKIKKKQALLVRKMTIYRKPTVMAYIYIFIVSEKLQQQRRKSADVGERQLCIRMRSGRMNTGLSLRRPLFEGNRVTSHTFHTAQLKYSESRCFPGPKQDVSCLNLTKLWAYNTDLVRLSLVCCNCRFGRDLLMVSHVARIYCAVTYLIYW